MHSIGYLLTSPKFVPIIDNLSFGFLMMGKHFFSFRGSSIIHIHDLWIAKTISFVKRGTQGFGAHGIVGSSIIVQGFQFAFLLLKGETTFGGQCRD